VTLVPDIQGVAKLEWGVPPDLVYAFENLVHNAIKYSKPDGGTVTVSLRVADDVARVEVIDHGIGIPTDVVDTVFLEFVRAPNAKQHVREGTGLGLSIVDEAIRMHGGRVAVASVEGEGSTFTVSLPLHFVPPEVARSGLVVEPAQ
jgi:two-component system sensor histidine kinase SenX3